MSTLSTSGRGCAHVLWRIAWVVVTICISQGLVCALSVFPVLFLWLYLLPITDLHPIVLAALWSLGVVPSDLLFALMLMLVSAVGKPPCGLANAAEHGNADCRRGVAASELGSVHGVDSHIRIFAGSLFRGSPIWTASLRLAGARLGRRVYVNSLALSDYNLLDFGDDVVIGADVHISGHAVEAGVVKTGTVWLGHNVTIGIGSIVDIDVEVDSNCQIGAFSLVPNHTSSRAGGLHRHPRAAHPLTTTGPKLQG